MMDRLTLSHIDEGLDSSEVAELCFLCRDVVTRRRLENIKDAKDLFLRLEEKGLLQNDVFLRQLLYTIHRADLLRVLETDSRPPEETDASPVLSDYRKTLYSIYNGFTTENFEKLKFLLTDQLGRRQMELSKTPLDVFAEMEKSALLSETDVSLLHKALQECDQQLAITLEEYTQGGRQQRQQFTLPPDVSMDIERTHEPLSITETQPNYRRESINTDAQLETNPTSLPDQSDYYTLTHNPRGLCVVFNNEIFTATHLSNRKGTQKDADTLTEVFTRLGFQVEIHDNCTAEQMKKKINDLGRINFTNHDALVVCVLSHGEKGCVFGTDGGKVFLKELTDPFTSGRASTLAGKPKLFFIQACQGEEYQKGYYPSSREDEKQNKGALQSDASIPDEAVLVPELADFLIGMATVEEFKSFRNTVTGSIYIQELCKQLTIAARRQEMDDILTVLTRVNREVSKGEYLSHKQMPQPNYTLTKKLVLKFV
ncbi:caspase-8-like [Astatotilapia calliptera]|uniref:Caspase-8 n=1 Tax=Astatotilapia calliptera TaxID=8154 RepID=A0A3P8Q862_ASTCA|nr:caspase-8-like [Astatotilapia calliptera]